MKLFPAAEASYVDGLTLDTPTWRANVRPSANDPVMRLNIEATTATEMAEIRDQMLTAIRAN